MDHVMVDNKRHYNSRIVLIICGISWAAIGYSYAGSVIATTLGQPTFYVYMGLAENPNAEALIGTITGLFYAGGVFGCLLNSWMADKFGRKWTVLTGSLILMIATACLTASVNVGMFIAFRFFVGAGAYMLYLSAPLWVTEIVPPKDRSILAGIIGLGGVVGYIIASYVGVGFFYYKGTGNNAWRAPLALGCFPPLVLLLCMPWLPESPRWLLTQGRDDEALAITKKLHTNAADPEHEYATAEFFQMKKQHELEAGLDSSWVEMFRRPSYRKRAAIAFMTPVILYSTGDLVVTTYAATIFSSMGYTPAQSIQLLAGILLAALAGNLISLTYVDRVPRNVILSVGVVAMTVVLSIETALLSKFLGTDNKSGLAGCAAFVFLFLFTFNLFCEGPSWYYAGEIFPTHMRAKGMTISVIGFCIVDIFWLELSPTAVTAIGWKYYLVFICVSIPGAILIYFKWPDTLGLPLEEVARLFGDDDLVAVFQQDIVIDHAKHEVVESQPMAHVLDEKSGISTHERLHV